MKSLCFKLVSLIPPPLRHYETSKLEERPVQDQVEEATTYIKLLTQRVEEMRRRRSQALMTARVGVGGSGSSMGGSVVEVREFGSNLEVVLISGLCKTFMLHQIISILEQEGAEVVNVNFSNIGDQIFHTIHAQVKVPRVGVDISGIRMRIQELIS
ncbi:Transcription factor [Sesamum angolense]|uniref:Transcription factor n=1 Tax=Sesamum angolense TaxID=2727404 RepID=A0AAE1WZB5_9LAMI|nr:Transcription factor [Sesamum angolense]